MDLKQLYFGKKTDKGREFQWYNLFVWLGTLILIGWILRKIFY